MSIPLLAYWEHDLSPFLIEFREGVGIRYYGLAYLLGFVIAAWLLRRYYKAGKTALNPNQSMDLILALVIGVMVGGRLGSYFLYDGWRTFSEDPLGVFKIWQGGMASHGGFLGCVIAMVWFARKNNVTFRHVADLVVTAGPAGVFLGRIANFINGELWGRPTGVPWAVVFAQTGGGDVPRHPSQLYEAALEGLFLFVVLQLRLWKTDLIREQPGRIAGEFLLLYAIVRAICEVFREPDSTPILGLTRGTFYSIFLVVGGFAMIWTAMRKK
jgi:phosphatidylglycerol---prolipoprotein diacylglyceryl transferase